MFSAHKAGGVPPHGCLTAHSSRGAEAVGILPGSAQSCNTQRPVGRKTLGIWEGRGTGCEAPGSLKKSYILDSSSTWSTLRPASVPTASWPGSQPFHYVLLVTRDWCFSHSATRGKNEARSPRVSHSTSLPTHEALLTLEKPSTGE